MVPVDLGEPDEGAGVPTWQAGDGAGLFVTVSEEERGGDPLPEVFGRWVSAYERDREAEVVVIASPPVAGATRARSGRLDLLSDAGEPLGLVILMAERGEGPRVTVQVTWPLLGPDRFEEANALAMGLDLVG
ncbi:MAG: hypothetical protein KDA98_07295 [Acidimicrobiales bacterium]|nr:hypothetical protein [Acidimicrobiales bacterium]